MKQPINPIYPISEVETVDQLMDIATAMEREATRRYEELAAEMERYGNGAIAALFRELADDEREHESQIAGWAVREGGRAPQPAAFRWRMPETFDLRETEASGYSLTPYEALRVAARNEENAFAFYTYLAAMAEDDTVRARAEALAKGELDHVARLHARQRAAYLAERGGRPRRPKINSLEEFHRMARGLEQTSAELDAALSHILHRAGDEVSATLLQRVAEEERIGAAELARKGAAEGSPGTRTAEGTKVAGILEPQALTAPGAVRLAFKNAEEVLQTYLDIAGHTKSETVMRAAQQAGEQAVARLASISARMQQMPGQE